MSLSISLLLSLSLLLLLLTATAKQTYIIHTKPNPNPNLNPLLFQSLSLSSTSLLYTYSTGFAASLTPSQATSLRNSPYVLSLYKDRVYSLHTTRSPRFLHLPTWTPLLDHRVTSDVIIGVLDTGVWPESRSFLDSGLSGIPSRWKGECQTGPDFKSGSCNNKLIGARSFSRGYRMSLGEDGESDVETDSPRDYDGHGTHTASTAAGGLVGNASLFGYANGTARGMAVGARVAVYKVCWKTGCFGSDILAGIEKAIEDGVDVLSMSLGGESGPYYSDSIAIGAFAAMAKGIFVSCSAGNSGPTRSSLANSAPWIMTVGAGTLDRDFPAYAVLGNNNKILGVSLYSGPGMGNEPVEMVYSRNGSSNLCLPGSLEPRLVKAKVVICDRGVNARVEKGVVVKDAGGVGMILVNTAVSGEELVADAHLIPVVAVGRRDGDLVREYVRREKRPTAVLSFGGTVLGVRPSPVVAAFSSRGPNTVVPEILKPDVIGPGVNILAAWSEANGPTGLDQDTRKTRFNIISGTSMSCPHISGVAALLKAAHPEWSPSAIKSALMTTAYTNDNTGSPLTEAAEGSLSTPFAHGSGHVDPHKAMSPGLVYDISTNDYIAFLCSLSYTYEHMQMIVQHSNFTCTKRLSSPGQLNYPSFSVSFGTTNVVRYTRVLTNVGSARSVYDVVVIGPASVGVRVRPTRLVFGEIGDIQRYTVTFVSRKRQNGTNTEKNTFGSLSWTNSEHQVRSHIAYAW